ncbi:MAG: hypothetical protein NZ920_05505 [Aigarchaeota archaeon]|nr:hypothetical protein [Aigarchaeota archaeon]MDW8092850.1 hypothetical protein [Nitrososphaerota archaeon]
MSNVLRAIGPVISIIIMNSIGSYVSAREAGLACPDWPLCPFPDNELVLLEFTHRAFAIVVLVTIVAALVSAFRIGGTIKKLAFTGLTLFLIQIVLGGVMVLLALRPELVAIHMAAASSVLAVFSMLAIMMIRGGDK